MKKLIKIIILSSFYSLSYAQDVKIKHADVNDVRGLITLEDGSFIVAVAAHESRSKDPLVLQKFGADGKSMWDTVTLDIEPSVGGLIQLDNGNIMTVGTSADRKYIKTVVVDSNGEHAEDHKLKAEELSASKITARQLIYTPPFEDIYLLYDVEIKTSSSKSSDTTTETVTHLRRISKDGSFTKESKDIMTFGGNGSDTSSGFGYSGLKLTSIALGEKGEIFFGGEKNKEITLFKIAKFGQNEKITWTSEQTLFGTGTIYGLVLGVEGITALGVVDNRPIISRYNKLGKLRGQKFLDKSLPILMGYQISSSSDGGYLITGQVESKKIHHFKLSASAQVEWTKVTEKPVGASYFSGTTLSTPLKNGGFLVSVKVDQSNDSEPAWVFKLEDQTKKVVAPIVKENKEIKEK